MKNIRFFFFEKFPFLTVKFTICLSKRVFVRSPRQEAYARVVDGRF